MYKIIDNFLEKEDFLKIKDTLLSDEFPWYYTKVLDKTPLSEESKNHNFQFTHTFYKDDCTNSNAMFLIDPIIKKISPKNILRIKANLNTKTEKIIQHGFHIDYSQCTTAIFYVNSNNGKTFFQNGDSIDSLENRLVIFDSGQLHSGSTCTDENVRCVINFNYV
jgi:hypothetical protein